MVNVGQIRESSVEKYLIPVSVELPSTRDVGGQEGYKDTVINCATLSSSNSYYFVVTVEKEKNDPSQLINIRLRHQGDDNGIIVEEKYQDLKTITLTSQSMSVEILFTPNAGYNQISFDLVRTDIDQIDRTRRVQLQNYSGKTPLQEIHNIVEDLGNLYSNPKLTTLRQIGVRSEPGLRMCINGEEIFVGPTGVYELYNGIQIKYLGFIITNSSKTSSKKSNFIVDFTYEGEEGNE